MASNRRSKAPEPPLVNTALLELPVVTDAERLVLGLSKPDVVTVTSLHTLVEAVVLHDRIVYPLIVHPSDHGRVPLFDALRKKGVLDLEATLAFSRTRGALLREIGLGEAGALDDVRQRSAENYPVLTAAAIAKPGYPVLTSAMRGHLRFWNSIFRKPDVLNVTDADELYRLLIHFAPRLIRERPDAAQQIEHIRRLLVMIRGDQVLADAFGAQLYTDPCSEPFLIADVRRFSLARSVYEKVARLFNASVERLLSQQGSQHMALPPLLTILLDGCHTREDIPSRLLLLRDDFSKLRSTLSHCERRLSESPRLGDQLDALDELDASWEALVRKTKMRSQRVVHKVWTIMREGSPLKIGRKVLDDLVEKDQEGQILVRLQGFADLWERCMNVQHYSGLVERIFKHSVHSNRPLFREFATLAEFTAKMHETRNVV